jgi:hypothetical protein
MMLSYIYYDVTNALDVWEILERQTIKGNKFAPLIDN